MNLLPESPERDGAAETEVLELASMLQRAVRAQRRYDAGARSMTERLHAVFSALGPKIQSFQYAIHPMFIQSTSVFVPLTYLSPAMPMLTELASVCTAWRYVNIERLLLTQSPQITGLVAAQMSHDTLDTSIMGGPVSKSAGLISEIKVRVCRLH